MNSMTLSIISYFSVFIPFITAIINYKKTHRAYYPFFYFLLLIAFSDLSLGFLNAFFFRNYISAIIANVNILVEICFVTWMFKQWGIFQNKENIYRAVIVIMALIWSLEVISYGTILRGLFFSGSIYGLMGALQSIILINQLIKIERIKLHTTPLFIICTGFIFFYLFTIIACVFSLHLLKTSIVFRLSMINISDVGVTISYLIFTYALILIARDKTNSNKRRVLISQSYNSDVVKTINPSMM
jgi:hypothetical protein